MPRRYYDYPARFEGLNALSTYGSWVLAVGLMLVLGYLTYSLVNGEKAPVNPWGAATLDWRAVPTPPFPHNFRETPVVMRGPYAFNQVDDLFGHDLIGHESSGDGAQLEPVLSVPEPESKHA